MRAKLLFVVGLLYSLLCLAVVCTAPRNSYEWMLTDPALAQAPRSFCELPLDDRWVTALFPLAFVAPLALLGTWALIQRSSAWSKPWMLAAAVIALACWLLRFVVFFPRCPAVQS